MTDSPVVFISYSHDDELHKQWVHKLACKLVENGVETILDQWDLKIGSNLPKFMESGLTNSDRVLAICTDTYIRKSNDGLGGVGYEKNILTAELLLGLDTTKFIPIIRGVTGKMKTPLCLGGRVYIDFSDDLQFDSNLDTLLRELYGIPASPKPSLGKNPFLPESTRKPSMREERGTVFFSHRFSGAFPGVRGIKWFDKPQEAIQRLALLLKEPLQFREGSPIWWWRTGDLQIDRFSVLDEGTVLLGYQELIVNKVAAVNAGQYYQQFVYLEVNPAPPTGVYDDPGIEDQLQYWGYAKEEYALFNGRPITVAEHDDNAAVIDGNVVSLEGKAETRVRYLTPYNLIIAAHDTPINSNRFYLRRDELLNNILCGACTLEDLVSEVLKLPKIER